MGLDMYAYSAARAGQYKDHWEQGSYDDVGTRGEFVSPVTKPKEIAYWRKHPNLHGWMEQLWRNKGAPADEDDDISFNGIELELTWEDLEMLEDDIEQGALPGTSGFFFGDPADDYYREEDLKFIRDARADLFLGLKVFYNSSWQILIDNMIDITKTRYPGWNDHPCYHVRTNKEYDAICAWMRENKCEEFLLSSGSNGYTFQVKTNAEWFALRWA